VPWIIGRAGLVQCADRRPRPDSLVLKLLLAELTDSIRRLSWSDRAWIVGGGGGLCAYAVADLVQAVASHADALREFAQAQAAVVAAATFVLGSIGGVAISRMALRRAFAPFLSAQPLSLRDRRRTVAAATCLIGLMIAASVAFVVGVSCRLDGASNATVWSVLTAALFGAGFTVGVALGMRHSEKVVWEIHDKGMSQADLGFPGLRAADRAGVAWLGSWAWNLTGCRVKLNLLLLLSTPLISGAGLLSVGASLAQGRAWPGALAGLGGGLAIFMLTLRCGPLASSVLRTSPLGFTHAWLRLLRLPCMVSIVFFALPAGAALAAEPTAWTVPLASGLGLAALCGTYGVFAAYFASSPLAAALSFVTALAYVQYESLEYGRPIYLALVGLILLLWQSARKRYRHG